MLTLKRYPEYLGCTPGILTYDQNIITHTLERPWKDNETDISCIPVGVYRLAFTYSPRFERYMLEITDVPDRTGIRVHSANVVYELDGCIAPCTYFTLQNNILYGTLSRSALSTLESFVRSVGITQLAVEGFDS